jgi:hypothetical protein
VEHGREASSCELGPAWWTVDTMRPCLCPTDSWVLVHSFGGCSDQRQRSQGHGHALACLAGPGDRAALDREAAKTFLSGHGIVLLSIEASCYDSATSPKVSSPVPRLSGLRAASCACDVTLLLVGQLSKMVGLCCIMVPVWLCQARHSHPCSLQFIQLPLHADAVRC